MTDDEAPQMSLFALARATFPAFLLVIVMVVLPRFMPMPGFVFHGLGAVILAIIAFSAHRVILLDQRGMAAFSREALPALARFSALTIGLWIAMRYAAGKLQLYSSALNEYAWFVAGWQEVCIFVVALIAVLWLLSKFAMAIPATALGDPLSRITTVSSLSNRQVFAQLLIQVMCVFFALALVSLGITYLERAALSPSLRSGGFFTAFMLKEIVIALWAVALSGALAYIYRTEFPVRRER